MTSTRFEKALDGSASRKTPSSATIFWKAFSRARRWSPMWKLVEEFPSRYDVEVSRQHRWVRGDWQLLALYTGHRCRGSERPGDLRLLGRWKMLDNLRRSLAAPAHVAGVPGRLAACR